MGGVQGALGSCLDDEGRLEGGELHHSPPQQFWVWLRNNYQQEKKVAGLVWVFPLLEHQMLWVWLILD